MSRIHSFLIYFREFFGATKNILKREKTSEFSLFSSVIFQIELDISVSRLRRFFGSCIRYILLFSVHVSRVCNRQIDVFVLAALCAHRRREEKEKNWRRDRWVTFPPFVERLFCSRVGATRKKRSKIHCRGCQKATDAINSKLGDAVVSAKKTQRDPKLNWIQNFLVSFTFPPMLPCFFLRSHENAIWNVRRRLKDDSRWIGRRCW